MQHAWGMRDAYNILVGKPEGKTPRRRRRRGWEDNIRVDLIEIGWECVDWIRLAQHRDQWQTLVNTLMDHLVPYKVGFFLTI
jgi:hypothetical protein